MMDKSCLPLANSNLPIFSKSITSFYAKATKDKKEGYMPIRTIQLILALCVTVFLNGCIGAAIKKGGQAYAEHQADLIH